MENEERDEYEIADEVAYLITKRIIDALAKKNYFEMEDDTE